MKSLLFSALFLLSIFVTRSVSLVAAATTTTNDLVYDTDGKKIRQDVSYYLGPVAGAKGGGIKLTKKTCPFNVVQDAKETTKGDSFNFTLLSRKEKYLREAYPLGIDSGYPKSSSDKSTFWKIEDPEAKSPANFVTAGGVFEEEQSCFQVVKYPNPIIPKVKSYMLQLCPSFCGAGPSTCFNISIYVDNGIRHLASSGTPFEFVFQKAF